MPGVWEGAWGKLLMSIQDTLGLPGWGHRPRTRTPASDGVPAQAERLGEVYAGATDAVRRRTA
jgi:hypothetical protein